LGAASLGDIGKHFPDTDARWKGADSRVLVREVVRLAHAQGWKIENIDATVIAQAPKLAPFIPQMKLHLMADLDVADNAVNVKATTTEKLGFTGRGEGIAAEAVCLLTKV
jgi:2-C-methyl-D-erythritol 2,4-cyclodiphosphate synthase